MILQSTGQAMTANQIMLATFQLGNSSAVRKRVTVILHDLNFSDLLACTFWIPPGSPLSLYSIRGFATAAWANATLSIYPATTGAETWMRVDNVTFQRTPGLTVFGTQCFEPPPASFAEVGQGKNQEPAAPALAPVPTVRPPAGGQRPSDSRRPFGDESGVLDVLAAEPGPRTLWQQTLDLRDADDVGLSLESWLVASESTASIEISLDGTTWTAIGVPPPADEWLMITVDLSPYAGQIVHVRMQFDGAAPRPGRAADVWGIRDIRVTRR